MPLSRESLTAAIAASGGAAQPDDQVDGLLAKLQLLEATGKFGGLLRGILTANDKSNFLALLLEATFAYQFERAGAPLTYEVKQGPAHGSSIDFGLDLADGLTAYFELRLLQQDQATAKSIADQLSASGTYAVFKDGGAEQDDVLWVQGIALGKVEDKHGKAIKFLRVDPSVFNIVVVDISDIVIGAADLGDCILATYGDPEVPVEYRREVFGLFQDVLDSYPEHIQQAAVRFKHFKSTIHAVLFLFRGHGSGPLDYSLEHVLVWNRSLVGKDSAGSLVSVVDAALPPREKVL
jgi:hypothetical protein